MIKHMSMPKEQQIRQNGADHLSVPDLQPGRQKPDGLTRNKEKDRHTTEPGEPESIGLYPASVQRFKALFLP